jgi:hypothetical protein
MGGGSSNGGAAVSRTVRAFDLPQATVGPGVGFSCMDNLTLAKNPAFTNFFLAFLFFSHHL